MKRVAGILLLGVIALAFFPACGTVKPSTGPDLTREVDRLQGLYREAVRVPITPQIVNQVRKEERDYLLGEIRYYTSVNIALMHSRAGESSMTLENRELPRVRRGLPVQTSQGQTAQNQANSPGSSAAQDAASGVSIEFQEIPILTFNEGGSSLDQRRITSDDEGHLKGLNPEGNVFEIVYPDRGITLGFALNQEENWYDLEFAVDENTGERTSLAMTGARPHLMINYQAIFPFGETRIQMDRPIPQTEPPGAVNTELWQPPRESPSLPGLSDLDEALIPPSSPEAGISGLPAEGGAENPALSSGEDETADLGEDFYLEEAPPTVWEDNNGEDLYLGGESPEVDVVFLAEKTSPPASAGAVPDRGPEETAPVFPLLVESVLSGPGNYIIQVGAFREKRNASAAFAALERAGFCPLYEAHQDLTRVLIPAVERGDLARVREKVKALGLGEPYVRQ
jgi:hypothetical protein